MSRFKVAYRVDTEKAAIIVAEITIHEESNVLHTGTVENVPR